jgi:hypothetical protein
MAKLQVSKAGNDAEGQNKVKKVAKAVVAKSDSAKPVKPAAKNGADSPVKSNKYDQLVNNKRKATSNDENAEPGKLNNFFGY